MSTSSLRTCWLAGAATLLAAALPGCERGSPVSTNDAGPSGTIAIDVSALHRPPVRGMQGPCASLAATMALRITPEHGSVQNFSRAVPAEASTVQFESIDVTEGQVTFSVTVTSDNGTILYASESTEQISPPAFQANLTLAPQAPVLQVCPGHIVLDRTTGFSDSLRVVNRGIGTLTYEAVSPVCELGACLQFDVPTGTALPTPGSQLITVLPRMTTQTSLELRVQTPAGSLPVEVTLGQLPDLVVDTMFTTDTVSFTNQGSEQPVRVVIRNVGNALAGAFKVAAEYTDIKGLSPGRFVVPGQTPDSIYSFTQNPLAPGEAVTLDGKIIFLFAGGDVPVMLRLLVDSCRGEELTQVFCRVDEFDEGNNVSAELPPNFNNF
jgi:hypothetical protein